MTVVRLAFKHPHRKRFLQEKTIQRLVLDKYDCIITEGEHADVLIHGPRLTLKEGAFHTVIDDINLQHTPARTLIFCGENIEAVDMFPMPITKVIRLLTRLLNLLLPPPPPPPPPESHTNRTSIIGQIPKSTEPKSAGNGTSPMLTVRIALARSLVFLIHAIIKVWLKVEKSNTMRRLIDRRKLYYRRPALTRYIQNLPGANNYVVATNKVNETDNILTLPLFFRPCSGDWQRFTEPKPGLEEKTRFCAFAVSGLGDCSRLHCLRSLLCVELSKYKPVDCYGPWLNNATVPQALVEKHSEGKTKLDHFTAADIMQACNKAYHPDCGGVDRDALNQDVFRDYKFVICFENSIAEDYITEELPNVMLGGSIGIHYGAPNVGEYFNPKSFINYADYDDYQAVIDRIIALDKDDEQYMHMLSEPYFPDNRVPEIIIEKEKALCRFLDRIFLGR